MLFKSADEVKKYLPQNASFEFEQILPFIKFNGEPELIIPAISQAQYDALNTAYNDNDMTEDLEKLLDKVRFPLANFAYMKYIPFAQLSISASGIHIETNDEKKTAFEWQINKLESACIENAYNGIEQLLIFLETNKATYTVWAASTSFTEFKECFVNTAIEFNNYFNIGKSRSTFIALKPLMLRMEEFHIKPVLGKTLYAAIKAGIASGTIPDIHKKLLEFIKPAVVNFTAGRAVVELPVKYSTDGIHVVEENVRVKDKSKVAAQIPQLGALQIQCEKDADVYMKTLEDFLYLNVQDYDDWVEEGSYVDPESDDAEPWDQSGSGFFSI
jgi:hypothetical protein